MMTTTTSQVISAVEAARRIYNTRQPTAQQVGRVVERIESGALARSPRGGMTTTTDAVAVFMARRETARTGAHLREPGGDAAKPPAIRHAEAFTPFYRGVLKDYFLAVVLRRKVAHRSPIFHRLVMASQAILILGILGLMVSVTARTLQKRLLPAEQRAAQAWLQGKYADCEIVQLQTLPTAGVRARFRYKVNGRVIQSELHFNIRDGKVVGLNSSD